ncbi:MAG: DUF4956 domain-containing protein [Gammaproteobacteria bacterium]|nr:DUF4956 domain-containing protein [Gammaproteobacteria bacterium]
MFEQELIYRYLIYLLGSLALLRLIFFRITPNRDVYFALFMFGNGVFFITYLLHDIDLSMGFAFGLFAIFSMLRYRTETLSVRDMTYFFTGIVLSLMCAVAQIPYPELAFIVFSLVALAAVAESHRFAPIVFERKITYDRVDKLQPEKHGELLEELRERTGLNIVKFELGKLDLIEGNVKILLFCTEGDSGR